MTTTTLYLVSSGSHDLYWPRFVFDNLELAEAFVERENASNPARDYNSPEPIELITESPPVE